MTTGVGNCRGGCGSDSSILTTVKPTCADGVPSGSLTPRQAASQMRQAGTYADWVTDVPIQGPTDPGIRRADCWWKNNVLDKVTDSQGAVVPRWTQHSLCIGNRLTESGIGGVGEAIRAPGSLGQTLTLPPDILDAIDWSARGAEASAANLRVLARRRQGGLPGIVATLQSVAGDDSSDARRFSDILGVLVGGSLSAPPVSTKSGPPAPPGIWSTLTDDQSHWVVVSLIKLNDLIVKSGSAPCATWPATLDLAGGVGGMPAAVNCFQGWFNANHAAKGRGSMLQTGGVLDASTLCALVTVAKLHAADFPTPFPGPDRCGLSLVAKIGIGVAAVAVAGGAVALSTRKKKGGRS